MTASDDNTLLILQTGTNDMKASRSEELMEKYKRMIQRYKEKSKNIIVSGILPRMNESDAFYTKAFSTNKLKSLCAQENVQFQNLVKNFCYAHNKGLQRKTKEDQTATVLLDPTRLPAQLHTTIITI